MPKKPKRDLAAAIKQLRGRVSQQVFANYVGLAVGSISRYERGAVPDVEVLRKLYERAIDANEWQAARTFADEIQRQTGIDPITRVAGLAKQVDVPVMVLQLEPEEQMLVVGLIKLLRSAGNQEELEGIHAMLDRWAKKAIEEMRVSDESSLAVQSGDGGSLPEFLEVAARKEQEHRMLSAARRFLQDDQVTEREKNVLVALLGEHF